MEDCEDSAEKMMQYMVLLKEHTDKDEMDKTARESKLAGRAGDESSSLKASMLEYFGEFSPEVFLTG